MLNAAKKNLFRQLLNVEDHKHCLSEENYGALLTLLLHLEEHQMHINIRAYDTESKELKKLRGNFFQLHVLTFILCIYYNCSGLS